MTDFATINELFGSISENNFIDVSMILWTRFGRIVSNQRRCPNESKIYQRIQGNNCSIARSRSLFQI